jgi:hypothetical protein
MPKNEEILRGYISVFKRPLDDVTETIKRTLPTVQRRWNNCEQYVDFHTAEKAHLARVRVEGYHGVVSRVVVAMPIGAEYNYIQEAFARHIKGIDIAFVDLLQEVLESA